jgi:hypothetical protein
MDGCFFSPSSYVGDAGIPAFFTAFFVQWEVRRAQFSILVVGVAAIAILMPVLVRN